MSENIQITTATVPNSFCFTTWQQAWSELVSLLSGTLVGNTNTFNYGNATPSAANRDKPWLRLNNDGTPDKWYVFYGGYWLSPIIPYSLYERRILVCTLAQVWAYDGGDGTDPSDPGHIPTAYTGATWEVDPEFDARYAIGAGTTAKGTVITVADKSEVPLNSANIPPHSHNIAIDGAAAGNDDGQKLGALYNQAGYVNNWSHAPDAYTASLASTRNNASSVSSGDSVEILPPYKAVYFVKRTARMFYTI